MQGTNRVVVAMSGGVDSSVAAAFLKERGFEVVGISMQLWDYSEGGESGGGATGGSCCSLEDIHDARRVADALEIPFYVVNMERPFLSEVVDYFVKGYMDGETPNPCIKCNEVMKFRLLMRKALELDAGFLATGHYARITVDDGGTYHLLKGLDEGKDQSYFLFTMTQDQMKRVLFPVGGLRKDEVRGYAARLGLRVAEKKDSQEICFIEGSSYTDFVVTRGGGGPGGPITDTSGNVLGTHAGLFRYTIGQRRGLDIRDGRGPYYVVDMDMERNRLVVGPRDELYAGGLVARDVNWTGRPMTDGQPLTVKIRYRHPGAGAVLTHLNGGRVKIVFSEPQKAVTPGQAAVFYSGEEVVGGGWIERALR